MDNAFRKVKLAQKSTACSMGWRVLPRGSKARPRPVACLSQIDQGDAEVVMLASAEANCAFPDYDFEGRMNGTPDEMAAFGRAILEAEDDMHVQARFTIVSNRDVADRAQNLRLPIDGDFPVSAGCEVEKPERCGAEGADGSQGCPGYAFILRKAGNGFKRLFAIADNGNEVSLAPGIGVAEVLAFHGGLRLMDGQWSHNLFRMTEVPGWADALSLRTASAFMIGGIDRAQAGNEPLLLARTTFGLCQV